MLATIDDTTKRIRQMEWIATATEFFAGCLPNVTDDDFDAAIDCAIHAYRLGHSGARCIFFGYDLARKRISGRAHDAKTI